MRPTLLPGEIHLKVVVVVSKAAKQEQQQRQEQLELRGRRCEETLHRSNVPSPRQVLTGINLMKCDSLVKLLKI